VVEGFPDHLEAEWASNHGVAGTKARLTWQQPITAQCVWLFDRPNDADEVLAARLTFSDGSTVDVGPLPNDASAPARLKFASKTFTWMEVLITRVSPRTRNVGLAEIAVFAQEPGE